MFRAVFMTFYGEFRGTEAQEHHLHESPPSMTVPLMVLAVGSVVAGWVGLPRAILHADSWLQDFLSSSMYTIAAHGGEAAAQTGAHAAHHLSTSTEVLLMVLSVVVALTGILLAWRFYGPGKALSRGAAMAARFPALHRLLVNKWYVDEAYEATVVRGTWGSARGLFAFDVRVIDGLVNGSRHFTVFLAAMSGFFDQYVIDRLVNATGGILSFGSRILRRVQTGFVSQYAFVFVLGVFAMVCLLLFLR
jgi:NADH-quinone oxidoreductase subunit L